MSRRKHADPGRARRARSTTHANSSRWRPTSFWRPAPRRRALRDATQTIPTEFVGLSDPVATGAVSNLARPTANVTGFSLYGASMSGKWLSLLKDRVVLRLTHAVIMLNPDTVPADSLDLCQTSDRPAA
jgi:hypothetical protein